ncbi:MAG: penicillin-binding protein 2 [Gemmatimonadetes bacterium]|nr:penicillin-binding protein 2 [Gemmatimonadota bacterium]
MQLFHPHARRRRALGARLVLYLGLGGLAAAFVKTQLIDYEALAQQAEANRFRPVMIPAPRGAILDRNGQIIADNIPSYAISILPASPDTLRARLMRLAPVLGLTPERVEQLLARHRQTPTLPLLISSDLTFDQISAVEERRLEFPTVFIEMRPKRRYIGGKAVAHLVGYVAEISERELAEPAFEGYEAGAIVGKAGLERQYERLLAGKPGFRFINVDARGKIVGDISPRPHVRPVPGKNLQLYLDLDLQRWAARVFPDTMRGAIVALEPGTGHVLAIYSNPSYDPNLFVNGVTSEVWNALRDDPAKPLLQRATVGLYPPGSTFKLATAAIGLELGVVDPKAYMPQPCTGGMQYGSRYFRCWDHRGHGYLNMADAIKLSCDVYFYQLGLRIGLDRLAEEGTRLGFSRKTGIDVPAERSGTFPRDAEWYRKRFGWKATAAEVLNLSIGQGPNDQTPLKMAQFYAALAADGRVRAPRLAVSSDPGEVWDLHISEENLRWLREGLRRVVQEDGTARLSALEHWDWIGKTGTAQNPHGTDHAWFVGMAGPRGGKPEIVVATIVEFGAHGSEAAQYAAKVADYYLRKRYGMPIDSVQTLRDYMLAGRPTPWARWQ